MRLHEDTIAWMRCEPTGRPIPGSASVAHHETYPKTERTLCGRRIPCDTFIENGNDIAERECKQCSAKFAQIYGSHFGGATLDDYEARERAAERESEERLHSLANAGFFKEFVRALNRSVGHKD